MKKKVFLSFAALTAAFTMNAQSKLPRFNEKEDFGTVHNAEFVKPVAKKRSVAANDFSYYFKANHDRHTDELNALIASQGGLYRPTGPSAAKLGLITTTTSSNVVTGNANTKFTTDFAVGNIVYALTTNPTTGAAVYNFVGHVKSIESNSSMTLIKNSRFAATLNSTHAQPCASFTYNKNSLSTYGVGAKTYPANHPYKPNESYWNKVVQGLPISSQVSLKAIGFYPGSTNGANGAPGANGSNILVSVYDKTGSTILGSTTVNVGAAGYKEAIFTNPIVTSDSVMVVFEMASAGNSFSIGYSNSYFKSETIGMDLFQWYLGLPDAGFNYTSDLPFAGDASIFAAEPNTTGASNFFPSLHYILREKFDFLIYPEFDYDLSMPFTASKTSVCAGDSVLFNTPVNGLVTNPIFNYMEWNKLANGVQPAYTYITSSKGDEIFENKFSGKVGFPTVGSFTVKAKGLIAPWSSNDFVEDSTMLTITVGKTAGTITGADAVCVGSKIQLTASVAGGAWGRLSGSSFSLISTTGEVTGAAAGQTVIRYTITGAGVGCPSVATKAVTVNALPATAGTITGSAWVCKTGGATKLTPSVAGGTWTSLKPSIATVDNQGNVTGLVKTSSLVTGALSYTVSTPAGCSRTILRSVGVDSTPVAPTIVGPAGTGAASICSNGTLLFRSTIPTATWSAGPYLTAGSTYLGLFTHKVAVNGAVPSDNFETFVKATSYSVNRVCTNFSTKVVKLRTATSKSFTTSSITAPASIAVNVNSNVSVVLPATLTLANTSNRAWNSSSTADMSVVATTNLSTTVKALKVPTVSPKLYFTAVETSTGCGMTAYKALTVTAAQSIVDANNDVNSTIGVNVYPNPSNGVVTFENIAGANSISLVDMTGRTVKSVAVNADRMTVDFSGVQNGKYLVQVAGENVNEVRSIVIE